MNRDSLHTLRWGNGIKGEEEKSTLGTRRDTLRTRKREVIKNKDWEIIKWKEEYWDPSVEVMTLLGQSWGAGGQQKSPAQAWQEEASTLWTSLETCPKAAPPLLSEIMTPAPSFFKKEFMSPVIVRMLTIRATEARCEPQPYKNQRHFFPYFYHLR